MLKDIRDNFRFLLTIILYLILIGAVIYGIYYGATIGRYLLSFIDDKEHPFLGALVFGAIGLILGYISIVLFFGSIITLLNIDENVQKITKVIMDLTGNKQLSPDNKTTESSMTDNLKEILNKLFENEIKEDEIIEDEIIENTRPIKKLQPHESAINAFEKTIAVIGDASISADDFAKAKTKLETAMLGLYKGLGNLIARANFAKMLNRADFEIIIETGNESPNANAHKSMTIGVDYLLTHDAEPTIARAIRDKVCNDNAFAD